MHLYITSSESHNRMVGVLTVKTKISLLNRNKGDSQEATLTEEGVPTEPTGFWGHRSRE